MFLVFIDALQTVFHETDVPPAEQEGDGVQVGNIIRVPEIDPPTRGDENALQIPPPDQDETSEVGGDDASVDDEGYASSTQVRMARPNTPVSSPDTVKITTDEGDQRAVGEPPLSQVPKLPIKHLEGPGAGDNVDVAAAIRQPGRPKRVPQTDQQPQRRQAALANGRNVPDIPQPAQPAQEIQTRRTTATLAQPRNQLPPPREPGMIESQHPGQARQRAGQAALARVGDTSNVLAVPVADRPVPVNGATAVNPGPGHGMSIQSFAPCDQS